MLEAVQTETCFLVPYALFESPENQRSNERQDDSDGRANCTAHLRGLSRNGERSVHCLRWNDGRLCEALSVISLPTRAVVLVACLVQTGRTSIQILMEESNPASKCFLHLNKQPFLYSRFSTRQWVYWASLAVPWEWEKSVHPSCWGPQ